MSSNKLPILCLDFDGCLAIKYTNPVQYYSHVPELIKSLSKTHKLYITSFNPYAEQIIESWELRPYFVDIRCGCNFKWTGKYREKYKINLSKSRQIMDMIPNWNKEDITLYDDSMNKLLEVSLNLPNVKIIKVDPKIGFKL